jgi:DUF1680 family protein
MDPTAVRLSEGLFRARFELNQRYVLSLREDALLQNFSHEAGRLGRTMTAPAGAHDMHWGWESPTCQLRGHFTGHWLSAAAQIYAATCDAEVKLRADRLVAELKRCQDANGGEWAGSIPEKYLFWISGQLPGHGIWAPHYTLHKTLMGLYDMHFYTGSQDALDVLERFARWFHRWTSSISRQQMDDILDCETGGMLEVWANLYGVSGAKEHLDLIERYDRPRLFDRLLAGEDALTNMHANTTIPEVQGAARAYEVTGDERWRKIVEAYWRLAVTDRGTFCTGGQTSGEIWCPPFEFSARLGDKNQEHCTVYNMIRLADYLLRWTGDAAYSDYIELNLYNGVLAQQNPNNGSIAYFLPLESGARKQWGHPTRDFWCCHGTLVQANAAYPSWAWLQDEAGPVLSQYIPSKVSWRAPGGASVALELSSAPSRGSSTENEAPAGQTHRPGYWWFELRVKSDRPVEFNLRLRIPAWLAGNARISIDGKEQKASGQPGSFLSLKRTWGDDVIQICLPKALRASPIPDAPEMVAFMDGPVVLAGLCDHDRALEGDPDHPEAILTPDNEREWGTWLAGYRTRGQATGLRLIPLHQVVDQPYTVYFTVRGK